MDFKSKSVVSKCEFITIEVIKTIIKKCVNKQDVVLKNYKIFNASDKMLGFLADYWKLQIEITSADNTNILHYFVKAISTSNTAKANMVKEMKLFEKEITFYTKIKMKLDTAGLSPWSPRLALSLNEAMIFEDLNYLQYKTRNKLEPFDDKHILLALGTLARFHGSSIIYEEKRSKKLGYTYKINDDHENDLNEGGYQDSDSWFIQCMDGSLEIVKKFSKYKDNKDLYLIEKRWKNIWIRALRLSNPSIKYRNVICHRDLWNNNILFKYTCAPNSIPESCLLVDFQAVRYQPAAGDVMLLLHCNLEHKYRKNNISKLLCYYYRELKSILSENSISIEDIISFSDFLNSCQEQNLWGLVVSACLVPQFWIDDDLTTKNFCDTASFENILTRNKAGFIQNMIEGNKNYKDKVLQIFEEIAEEYCLQNKF